MKMFASVDLVLNPTYRSRHVLCVSEPAMACQNEKQYRSDEILHFHARLIQLRPSRNAFVTIEFLYSAVAGQSTYSL
jgi:hypothetical protein